MTDAPSPANTRSAWRQSLLYQAFHGPGSRAHAWLEATIFIMVAASVSILGVQLIWGAQHPAYLALDGLDSALTWAFLVEYLLRLGTFLPASLEFYPDTRRYRLRAHLFGRLRYSVSPSMLVDLFVVLSLTPQLRGLRALRLLRLFRVRGLFRYNNPFDGLVRALSDNRLLFGFGLSLLGMAAIVGGLSLFLVEVNHNPQMTTLQDGLWWALVTLTTVGYGDISPITGVGRVIGALLMVCGMFGLALFAGLVGHALLHAVLGVREEQLRMSGFVNHLVICGFNPGAHMLLAALSEELDLDTTHVVLFANGERPRDVPLAFKWVSGDPTKESELDKVRMDHARAVVIVGERNLLPQQADAQTILTVFTVRSYMATRTIDRRRPIYVLAEILDAENVQHARTSGANEVVETTRMGFAMLAHALAAPGSGAVISAVASTDDASVYVGEIPKAMLPGTFGEVSRQIKAQVGALLLGVVDVTSGKSRLNPPDEEMLPRGTRAVYLAKHAVLPRAVPPRNR